MLRGWRKSARLLQLSSGGFFYEASSIRLGGHPATAWRRWGTGLPRPQLARGNALIVLAIKELQCYTEMREEEPFCSRGSIYGCPEPPGVARLNATTSRRKPGSEWCAWG